MNKVNVALVGLGFGGAFVEIYKCHPYVGELSIFDIDREKMSTFGNKYHIAKQFNCFEDRLQDRAVDAVHLVTPIPQHEEQTISVLEAGKHCACTVPMAISLEGIHKITKAVQKSGKNYMMMETTLYTYQFFYVKKLLEEGRLGKIQFMRGSHYQDMANWPDYWMGLPPMYYGTHAIAPMVALSNSRIKRVHALGSGTMASWMEKPYGNPFPVESALFEFENGMKGEATRTLFETARAYQEGFFVYGSHMSFEWGFRDHSGPFVTTAVEAKDGSRGRDALVEEVEMPNFYEYLPKEIQKFTVGKNYDPLNPQESMKKGGGAGHHGSHPHLVHEFLTSIVQGRKPWINEKLGGNITGAGICAHLSAMHGGEPVEVKEYE